MGNMGTLFFSRTIAVATVSSLLVCYTTFAQGTVTLTSTVAQSNAAYSTTASSTGANGLNGATGANDPAALTASAAPFDFTGQDFSSLTSITSISITLTIYDGDTAAGEFDAGALTLGLYAPGAGTILTATDTALTLNGFGAEEEPTLTFTTNSPANAAAILSALKTNGTLGGAILDSTGAPNSNGMTLSSDFMTNLSVTGAAIPEPGEWVFLSLAGLAGGAVSCPSPYGRGSALINQFP